MPGSELYRQHHNFLAGTTQFYPLYLPGAKTFFVGPSTYTAVGGLVPSDGNDGESPQSPLLTIARAHTLAVASRGDTICLMPGTFTLTAALAFTKIGVRLVALRPWASIITGDGVITNLLAIDGNDIEVAGIRFLGVAAAVVLVDVANTSVVRGFHFHHNKVIGLETVASVEGILNGENIAGNNNDESLIEDNYFEGLSQACITTFGSGAVIRRNIFNLDDTASATGVTVGDQGAAFAAVKGCYIYENKFNGQTDASALLAITVAGSEANTQMVYADRNGYANCAAPTQDRHPEGWLANYLGAAGGIAAIADAAA